MYLPKSKYSKPLYTRGDEYLLSNNTFYTGWYFTTYKGEAYTGKVPSRSSRKLLKENRSDLFIKEKFSSDFILPTPDDMEQGFMIRYYIQDKRTKSIIEVKKERYNMFIKQSHLIGVQIKWDLSKPSDDVKKGPYIYFGSASKNKETVLLAEETIVGLSSAIKSYSEFVK